VRNENETDFTVFVRSAEPQLRQALVAAFGADLGRDAAAEALAWGWQNWDRLSGMDNPIGYLYRVGRTHGLREAGRSERPGVEIVESTWEMPDFEPALALNSS